MNDIRPDVILANTANITFNTPVYLLCQSIVSERQQMLDGHTNRKVLDPSWLSPWPMFRSMTGWERRQVPEAEKTTHEWLWACFIFKMIICWQEWVSVAGMGCQVTWWWHHPRLFFDSAFVQDFHPGLWPGLIPLLILRFELCDEVSPLRFPYTTVCEVADSVVCQVTMLPSFNSLWG